MAANNYTKYDEDLKNPSFLSTKDQMPFTSSVSNTALKHSAGFLVSTEALIINIFQLNLFHASGKISISLH